MIRRSVVALLSLATVCLSGCAGEDAGAAPTLLRFSGIPDADRDRLNANGKVVEAWLAKELGVEVVFKESTSYGAACQGVASNKLDLVWLGGVTAVQAEKLASASGGVTLVACRESDLRFRSYFIANQKLVASGKLKKVDRLEDLKAGLEGCTFTFGAKDSTSGRWMPQHFMLQAGIDPQSGVKGGALFREAGGHVATLDAVATGAVDVGAMNYKTWDDAAADKKANAPVIYTTPPYVDYCMVANNRLGEALIDRIRAAFTALDASDPEDKKVLAAFSAKKFVAAKSKDWDQIRAVLKKGKPQ